MKRVQSVFLSLRGSRMGDAVRLLRTSGSPRAFLNALAMTGVVGVKARGDNTLSVIARRERSEGRGNPSCPEGRLRGMRFGYWLTVDRHGLRPRDDRSEKECEGMRSYILYADDIARNGAIKAEVVLIKINRTRTWLWLSIF